MIFFCTGRVFFWKKHPKDSSICKKSSEFEVFWIFFWWVQIYLRKRWNLQSITGVGKCEITHLNILGPKITLAKFSKLCFPIQNALHLADILVKEVTVN